MRSPSLYSQDDPISAALKPPETETEAERTARLYAEAEAKRVSEQIDEHLRDERERIRKRKGDVKLLLLGQAESGKSTLQKQFQLMYRPHSLEKERFSWRTVIYFNVVRSIRQILSALETLEDTVDDELGNADDTNSVAISKSKGNGIGDQPSPSTSLLNGSIAQSSPGSGSIAQSEATNHSTPVTESGPTPIALLRLRLSHLVSMDAALADRLSGGITVSGSGRGGVYVRSGWQSRTIENALGKAKNKQSSTKQTQSAPDFHDIPHDPLVTDVARMLKSSEDDIRELWSHPVVQELIAKRRLKLDEWSEFFLRHISRVAAPDYLPTTDDILHARIQTMGVAEHVFDVNIHGKLVTWHLYDVGGARGQRHTWVPYFDDANAIIFVAPVSAFDQYLEEDPRTNRIDDSLQLFTQICSNALLKNVHLVLFLNKTDILRTKLERGLKVKKYITSFGDRPNDYETTVQYFRAHFLQVHRKNNENRRVLYTHFTSVVDTKATQRIIGNVRDSIFRGYLQSAALV